MEDLLAVLKEAAVFMLAARMVLHFGPGKKYEKYGKMTAALLVLSLLAVPVLSLGREERSRDFLLRAEELERQNRVFSQKLEQLDFVREEAVQGGLIQSVEEKIAPKAEKAGVSVADVGLQDGVLVIAVRSASEKDAWIQERAVTVERVEIGAAAGADSAIRKDTYAGAAAFRGKVRPDLAAEFGAALHMGADEVEVIELE